MLSSHAAHALLQQREQLLQQRECADLLTHHTLSVAGIININSTIYTDSRH